MRPVVSKWRENHPKRPHQHDDLNHLERPYDHLVEMHGQYPQVAAALVQDGADGLLIHGELPVVIHHRTDHTVAVEFRLSEVESGGQ